MLIESLRLLAFGFGARMLPLWRRGLLVLLQAPIVLLSGCATSALWDGDHFARFHEPDRPPNLSLFYSEQRQDVLVRYVEVRDTDGASRHRSYWMGESADRIQQRKKPRFVRVESWPALDSIPVLDSPAASVNTPTNRLCAMASTSSGGFMLCFAGQPDRPCCLPVYEDASGRIKQSLLTPLTVAADITIVGGVIAYCFLPSSWEALNMLNH